MSDLVERLREAYRVTSYNSINGCAECGIAANDAMEAADRIAQLEAALRPFACKCVGFCTNAWHDYGVREPLDTCKFGRARAALGEERT